MGRPWARCVRGWVGYFVEVFGGLERKKDLGCGGEKEEKTMQGNAKAEVERKRRETQKKGLDRDKRGEARRRKR